MWIRYIIPEDGDDQSHPNVFKFDSRSNTEVSASDIIKVMRLLFFFAEVLVAYTIFL